MKYYKLIISILLTISLNAVSQNEQIYKDIDNQIWMPFAKAYETLDYKLFESLHTDDLVRISANGKRIQGKEAYIAGYKERWNNSSRKQTISFRFLERLHNEQSASERGIYKLSINPNTNQEQNYYGKFHVILKNQAGIWKIIVDYDSSESNTINKESFNNAFAINDYSKY